MKDLRFLIGIIVFFCLISCNKERTAESSNERAAELFNGHCAACHIAPDPSTLPKHLWKNAILPDMGARMGIYNPEYNPLAGFSFSEQEQIIKTGIYSRPRTISDEDWILLQEYIIQSAPDSLETISHTPLKKGLPQFTTTPIDLDSIPGSSISFLGIDTNSGSIYTANLSGNLLNYTYEKGIFSDPNNYQSAITSHIKKDSVQYVTTIGFLNPSEISAGTVHKISGDSIKQIITGLHRPVYTSVYDFDKDGKDEILVSEFGHLTGALSLWKQNDDNVYEKTLLLDQPGVMRTEIKDMDRDGNMDIVLLTAQGNEGIAILYQTTPLSFRMDQVLRFNPVYGTSWFEIVDYDGDGHDDIITVNGDNADKTYIQKPYHGMRIHINNGKNNFEEKYFYPMNGATRLVADDFDNDNDIDIALLSSFPDYEKSPDFSFVYLENIDSKNFKFETFGLEDPSIGRWLIIDAGDIDQDGDQDIVLSSFTYYFAPVPKDLNEKWKKSNVDILVLENILK